MVNFGFSVFAFWELGFLGFQGQSYRNREVGEKDTDKWRGSAEQAPHVVTSVHMHGMETKLINRRILVGSWN